MHIPRTGSCYDAEVKHKFIPMYSNPLADCNIRHSNISVFMWLDLTRLKMVM